MTKTELIEKHDPNTLFKNAKMADDFLREYSSLLRASNGRGWDSPVYDSRWKQPKAHTNGSLLDPEAEAGAGETAPADPNKLIEEADFAASLKTRESAMSSRLGSNSLSLSPWWEEGFSNKDTTNHGKSEQQDNPDTAAQLQLRALLARAKSLLRMFRRRSIEPATAPEIKPEGQIPFSPFKLLSAMDMAISRSRLIAPEREVKYSAQQAVQEILFQLRIFHRAFADNPSNEEVGLLSMDYREWSLKGLSLLLSDLTSSKQLAINQETLEMLAKLSQNMTLWYGRQRERNRMLGFGGITFSGGRRGSRPTENKQTVLEIKTADEIYCEYLIQMIPAFETLAEKCQNEAQLATLSDAFTNIVNVIRYSPSGKHINDLKLEMIYSKFYHFALLKQRELMSQVDPSLGQDSVVEGSVAPDVRYRLALEKNLKHVVDTQSIATGVRKEGGKSPSISELLSRADSEGVIRSTAKPLTSDEFKNQMVPLLEKYGVEYPEALLRSNI